MKFGYKREQWALHKRWSFLDPLLVKDMTTTRQKYRNNQIKPTRNIVYQKRPLASLVSLAACAHQCKGHY